MLVSTAGIKAQTNIDESKKEQDTIIESVGTLRDQIEKRHQSNTSSVKLNQDEKNEIKI